jgi:hypothetical protein
MLAASALAVSPRSGGALLWSARSGHVRAELDRAFNCSRVTSSRAVHVLHLTREEAK